jgi:pimeloyl-ACP methyl ester carboxylesterase
MNAEHEPTLLEELRELHRSERAPAELERSVLERLLPSRSRSSQARSSRSSAPLGARVRAWCSRAPLGWTVLGATLGMAALGAVYLADQTLSVEASRVLGPEPRVEVAAEAHTAVQNVLGSSCPLDDLPPGFAYEPSRMDPEAARAGLQLDTFAMPIAGCPDLVRRTLSYVPRGLTRGPVVLVLHDGGDSAEGVRARQARGSFEALAEREGFSVVYANAAPAAGRPPNSGVWCTDPGAHRSIDDFAYLSRVVERLGERAGPAVYLVGYGSGAQLALEAAARHPERYAGVAALLPDQINMFPAPPRRADTRLSRLLFVTLQAERPWAYWPGVPLDVASIDEWAVALGLPRLTFQQGLKPELESGAQATLLANAMSEASLALRQVVPAGTRLLDLGEPDHGGPAVRVVVVQSKDAIGVGPGGSPAFMDAAALAWDFFQRGGPGAARP